MKCFKCATPLPDNSRFCSTCGTDVSGGTSGGGQTVPAEQVNELENLLREEVGGDFVIERELGRGGMAAVFLGHDVHLERPVAIKVLPPELTYGPGSVERFRREAKTAATLDHPNIIPVYRVSSGGKLFWYAMKYLDGEALSTIIERDGALSIEDTANILSQTADALQYAHEHGVIHRDVKPANVMVDSRGRVIVTDFGIAKALTAQSMTGSGAMMGTPYYMSPEQCSGKKNITGAADQYSLGIMVYQMLTAHLPFTGESIIDIVKQHCMDPVPPLTVLAPSIPQAVADAVEQALAKTPEDRFPTVLHFSEAFRAAAGLAPLAKLPKVHVAAKRISSTVAVDAARSPIPLGAAPKPPAPAPPVEVVRPPRRMRAAVIVLVLAGVAGGGVGTALWLRSRGAEAGRETAGGRPDSAAAAPTGGAQPGTPAGGPADAGSAGTPASVAGTPQGQPGQLAAEALRAAPGPSMAPGGAAPVPRRATVSLAGVPSGATVRVDGVRARGSVLQLAPGVEHNIEVRLGEAAWRSGAVTLTEGERRSLAVAMPAASGQPPPAGGAGEAMGTITVGSTPPSTLYLNGARIGRTPQRNVPVRAGTVTARFELQDSTGTTRCQVRTFTVASGQLTNGGIVPLTGLGPC